MNAIIGLAVFVAGFMFAAWFDQSKTVRKAIVKRMDRIGVDKK